MPYNFFNAANTALKFFDSQTSVGEITLLALLHDRDMRGEKPACTYDLAQEIDMPLSTLYRLIQRLESERKIVSISDPTDDRRKLIRLHGSYRPRLKGYFEELVAVLGALIMYGACSTVWVMSLSS